VVVAALAGTANAVPVGKWDSQVIGTAQIDANDPTVAYVTARYVCSGGVPHLWVSVKQTADRGADPLLKEEGSSEYAAAYSQSHPTDQVVCDGTWRTQTFKVDQTEIAPWDPSAPQGHGTLREGQAYIQFCLLDVSTDTFAYSMRFGAIR
jgi:hypothetical protein